MTEPREVSEDVTDVTEQDTESYSDLDLDTPWPFEDASRLAEKIAEKGSDLSNLVNEEDPQSAIEIVDELSRHLSELRSELSDLVIPEA